MVRDGKTMDRKEKIRAMRAGRRRERERKMGPELGEPCA